MKTNVSLARLLETCCHKNATDALVVPGSPPLIRIRGNWQSAGATKVLPSDVTSLTQQTVGLGPSQANGYSFCDFNFGGVARFKAIAFGFPQTTFLLLVHLPQDSPPGNSDPVIPGA
jgi:hypothetical protein